MTQTTGTGISAGPQRNCPLSLEAEAGKHTWLQVQVIHTADATAEETAKAESLEFDAGLALAFSVNGDTAGNSKPSQTEMRQRMSAATSTDRNDRALLNKDTHQQVCAIRFPEPISPAMGDELQEALHSFSQAALALEIPEGELLLSHLEDSAKQLQRKDEGSTLSSWLEAHGDDYQPEKLQRVRAQVSAHPGDGARLENKEPPPLLHRRFSVGTIAHRFPPAITT